jgi:NTP pyrophosphatase (non-canonical NTP hydrolase)
MTHPELVKALKKPGQEILDTLTPEKCDLLHMAIGLSGEAGELLDAVKKHVIYNQSLDISNVIEELGDLEFFMEGIRQVLRLKREDILFDNVNKLSIRYGSKYSDAAAKERKDKA